MTNESQNIEWKEAWRDEYIKWICGFANAQGGKIYIGTDDNGRVVGVADSKKLLEDIPNKVRDILGIIVDVNTEYDANNHRGLLDIDLEYMDNPIFNMQALITGQKAALKADEIVTRYVGYKLENMVLIGIRGYEEQEVEFFKEHKEFIFICEVRQ